MTNASRATEHTHADSADADVIVIGVGTGGEDLSLRLLDAGLDVIGIQDGLVGGECPFWACLPTKTMIRSANALQEARRADGLAGDVDPAPSWDEVAERVRATTGGWDDSGAIERYEKHGGHLIKGRGELAGPGTVKVGEEVLTARKGIVIGTGSTAVIPPVEGLEHVEYWTTHDAIQVDQLPDSIAILGGGASGCEIGQVMARFDVDVTIAEARERLLSREEPEASEEVERAFESEGIDVRTGAAAERVEARDGEITVILTDGSEVTAERLLVATGRSVDLSDLGLESVGVDDSTEFLETDDSMRVTDGIWAMGDVTGKGFYSHVALYQSAIIASEILGEDHPPARYHAVPRGTFTDPEVGSVGMTESEARDAGLDLAVAVKSLPATFKGFVTATEGGFVKLIADRDAGTLIGATAVGPQGTEMLGMLNVAVHARVPIADLQNMIYAFPTFYGATGAALGAWGRGLMLALDPSYDGVEALDTAAGRGDRSAA